MGPSKIREYPDKSKRASGKSSLARNRPLGGRIIGSQEGKTCCGRVERCDIPPCSDNGVCKR